MLGGAAPADRAPAPLECLVTDDAAPGRDDLLSEAFYRDRKGAGAPGDAGGGGPALRRLLPRLLAVVGVLVAADLLVRAQLPPEDLLPWTLGEEAAYTVKVDRLEDSPAPDVLFLGSSRVRDGIVPAVFAEELGQRWSRPATAFNLGLMNAKAEEYLCLVRSHLPDPPPARVVLGITGSEVVNTWNFQYASRFLWDTPDIVDWWQRREAEDLSAEHVEWFLERRIGQLWYVYGHRDALREGFVELLRTRFGLFPLTAQQRAYRADVAREVRDFVLSADGYNPPEEAPSDTLDKRLKEQPDSVHVPSRELERSVQMTGGDRFDELRAIAAILAERGIRLALVEMPVSPYLQQLNPVLHGPVFRQRMSELAAELEIVWVPMPAEETFLANSAYLDVNHLTASGARRYTRMLFRKLDEQGFFAEPAR